MTPLGILSPAHKDRLFHNLHVLRSGFVDTDSLRSVCLALGPYRNLTTLTASLLALHPNCQVLNHAGERIFADRRLNFLADYSDQRFRRFVQYAIVVSKGGGRGQQGGSITHSHAFRRERMRSAFKSRFGDRRVKDRIFCLFWKESLRTANVIRRNEVDLEDVFARNRLLRFLMPVRNPLDCAVSNLKKGHARLFEELGADATLQQVLTAVLGEIRWTLDQQQRHPTRFFVYYENDFTLDTVAALRDFLELPEDGDWMESVLSTFEIDSAYDHDEGLVAFYRVRVNELFACYSDARERLLAFAPK